MYPSFKFDYCKTTYKINYSSIPMYMYISGGVQSCRQNVLSESCIFFRHYVTLSTIKGEEYVVFTQHSEDLFQLVSKFLDGLKRKSKYGLVVQDCSQYGKHCRLSVVLPLNRL